MKFLFKVLLFLFFFSNSYSYELEIKGLNKLSLNDLNEITSINLFQSNFTEDEISIMLSEFNFSNLIFDLKSEVIKNLYLIEIIESKKIENIYFNGNLFAKDTDLLSLIKSNEKSLLIKDNLSLDIKNILSYYRSNGFKNSNIDVVTESFSSDRINLIFNINEGNKSKISSISFSGNYFFSDKFLNNLIKSDTVSFLNIFNKGSNLNPELFSFDSSLIVEAYKNKGFRDVTTSYELISIAQNTFSLKFYINEGKRYQLKNINYKYINNSSYEKINKIINNFENELNKNNYFYDQNLIEAQLDDLNNFLISNNIQNSIFSYNLDLNATDISILFFEKRNKPIVINKIQIEGNSITKDKTIRSKLLFESGDLLYENKVQSTLKDLNRLKYINSADIFYNSNENLSDITIKIDENKKTGSFLIAGSISGDTGLGLALGLKDSNFLGSGNEINSSVNINSEKSFFKVNFKKYSNMNKYLTHNYSLFNEENDFLSSYGFKAKKYGFGYDLGFRLTDKANISSGISYQNIKGFNSQKNLEAINDNIGTFDNLNFSINYNFDSTNDFLYPTNGSYQNFNLKISPKDISDDAYFKINLNSDFYRSFRNTNFLFFLNNFGYAESFSGNLKTLNAFGLGGLNFKGFDYRGVGPFSDDIYLGGNKYFSSTIGIGGSFLFDQKDKVNSKLFISNGSIWDSDYSNDNNFNLRSSMGISLDFLTAVGPLSLIYAVPIQKENNDKVRNFNFTLGTSF